MRKKTFRTAACLLLAAVVLASFAALASGGAGSQGDPLVTLSYLNDTFLTQVLEKVDKSLDERGGRLRGEIDQQIAQREQELRAFAEQYWQEPIFYTTGAGLDYQMCYIMTVCILLEAQWIHSASFHAGEFFHGPFEVVDENTPYFVTLGLDETRPMEERALEFLLRTSRKVFAVDARDFDLSGMEPRVRKWIAPVVLNRVLQMYGEALALRRAHPLSIRRYMGKMSY